MKLSVDFLGNCAILFPVMRDKNIKRSEAESGPIASFNHQMEQIINTHKLGVLVSCCGCNEELRISQHEADQWTDTDWFQCHECE